jgi:hypothetical protein
MKLDCTDKAELIEKMVVAMLEEFKYTFDDDQVWAMRTFARLDGHEKNETVRRLYKVHYKNALELALERVKKEIDITGIL